MLDIFYLFLSCARSDSVLAIWAKLEEVGATKRENKGRFTLAINIFRTEMIEQESHHVNVPLEGGQMQRSDVGESYALMRAKLSLVRKIRCSRTFAFGNL
jgi:hypothetical protein